MLASYLTETTNLLQNPAAPTPLYSTSALTGYINTARGQLAGEAQCIRAMGTLATAATTGSYAFSAVTLPSGAGLQGLLAVRTIWLTSGTSLLRLQSIPFEQFSLYQMNYATPATGNPAKWAQFAQGASGSIYVYPIPAATGGLQLDCVCYPIALVDDTTVEAIPYLWTDAVPYFAAYLALLSAQTGARTSEADAMFKRYQMFVQRARRASTPDQLPWIYEQSPTPGGLNAPAQQQSSG